MATGLPLEDVTVIEIGHSVAAPYAGQILADLGADVIKIEKSEGDDARKWAPPFWKGMSSTFQSLNRNKRSAVVNLKDLSELALLRQLIFERGDVVIQNLRPGSAEQYGLDATTLRSLKPELICCTIGAFGAKGPLKDRPGYDPLMQAFAGMMSVTGEPDHPPVRVGTSIVDMAAGMWCVIGVLSALLQRGIRASGASLETSLYETALAWMIYHAANFQASGELPKRQGSGAAMIVPYRGYVTKDGYIVIAAGNDKLFAALATVLDRPEWLEDPRYKTNPDRVRNQTTLYKSIEAVIVSKTSNEWQLILDAADIPNAPMQTIAEVLDHPQTKALGMLQPSPDGAITLLGLPLSFDGHRPQFRRSPPALGADPERCFSRHSPSAMSKDLSTPYKVTAERMMTELSQSDTVQINVCDTFPEIRNLARRVCVDFPGVYWRKLEETQEYPKEFVDALTKAGLLASLIPEEFGGLGLSLGAAAATLEEIHAHGCNAGACHAQMYMMGTVLRHGSVAQQRKYLPRIAAGELRLQAFGVTEPTSGSDTTKLKTLR